MSLCACLTLLCLLVTANYFISKQVLHGFNSQLTESKFFFLVVSVLLSINTYLQDKFFIKIC